METVEITLTPGGQIYKLPKETLLAVFPESLLAQTTEYGDTFTIPNPLITPSVMAVIQALLTGQHYTVNPQDDWAQVARYLNMPELVLLSEPTHSYLQAFWPEITPVTVKSYLRSGYAAGVLMRTAIDANLLPLAQLVRDYLGDYELNQNYTYAAYLGRPEIVALIQPKINPETAEMASHSATDDEEEGGNLRTLLYHRKYHALYLAIANHYPAVVAVILQDPRVQLPDDVLEMAVEHRDSLVLLHLLGHPSVTQKALTQAAGAAWDRHRPDIVRMLLRHPLANPDAFPIRHIIPYGEDEDEPQLPRIVPEDPTISQSVDWSTLDAIVTDPRGNFNQRLALLFVETNPNDELIPQARIVPLRYVEKWLADPRFDPAAMPVGFYISMVWYWPIDRILRPFYQHYLRLGRNDVTSQVIDAYLKPFQGGFPQEFARNADDDVKTVINEVPPTLPEK